AGRGLTDGQRDAERMGAGVDEAGRGRVIDRVGAGLEVRDRVDAGAVGRDRRAGGGRAARVADGDAADAGLADIDAAVAVGVVVDGAGDAGIALGRAHVCTAVTRIDRLRASAWMETG